MILIDREGNILSGWRESMGPVKTDKKSPYRPDFMICLHRTDEQKEKWKRTNELKNNLKATDYQTHKYIEGEYTDAEWAEKKAQRALWRDEIREIEKDWNDPTITLEEMREAERKAMPKIEAIEALRGEGQDATG